MLPPSHTATLLIILNLLTILLTTLILHLSFFGRLLALYKRNFLRVQCLTRYCTVLCLYHVLSCPVLPCPALPCPVLPPCPCSFSTHSFLSFHLALCLHQYASHFLYSLLLLLTMLFLTPFLSLHAIRKNLNPNRFK